MTDLSDEWLKSYRHGVVPIGPPDEVRSPMNALPERYDPVSQSHCEAHISLTPPFLHAPTEPNWHAIERAVEPFEPFDIALGPVNGWLSQSVIYLEVRPAADLECLNEALLATRLFAEPQFKTFVPHLTITEGFSSIPVTDDLFDTLKKAVAARSFYCDRLAYVRPDENFRFWIERTIVLGRVDLFLGYSTVLQRYQALLPNHCTQRIK
ncbi:MAG: 2'-5' RNA ligase family protein, partial [Hyphomicrobiaceae bacterium]